MALDFTDWAGLPANPKFTQIPDEVFDLLMSAVTPAEFKVLMYIARHTWGWKKPTDRISIAQMVTGQQRKDGTWQDHGTGLSRSGIKKAVQELEEKNLITVEREVAATGNCAVNLYQIRTQG